MSDIAGTSLRLFGFEFPKETSASPESEIQTKDGNSSTNVESKSTNATIASATSAEATASRKFECHYCFRNFPTSQALGGHQNAHKRERQQAKRAQFQTSMLDEGHRYNYSPFASYQPGSMQSSARFEVPTLPPHYPSWVNGYSSPSTGTRFYSGLGSVSEPISVNPVSNMWRLPVRHDRPMVLPPFGGGDPKYVVGSSFSSSNNLVQEKGVKDGVSLDLHL